MAAQKRATSRASGAPWVAGEMADHTATSRAPSVGRAIAGGVLLGALMVPTLAAVTAAPALAAGPLLKHPLDLHIDVGRATAQRSPGDVDGLLDQIGQDLDGLLSSSPTPARPGAGGSGSGRRTVPTHGGAPANVPTPTPAAADAGLETGAVPGGDADSAPATSPVTAAVTPFAAPAPTLASLGHPTLKHGQLITAGDQATITALDVVAVTLAGIGLVGVPLAARRRGAGR
jgi:hypothetical protein